MKLMSSSPTTGLVDDATVATVTSTTPRTVTEASPNGTAMPAPMAMTMTAAIICFVYVFLRMRCEKIIESSGASALMTWLTKRPMIMSDALLHVMLTVEQSESVSAWMDKRSEGDDLGGLWLENHGLSEGSEAPGPFL